MLPTETQIFFFLGRLGFELYTSLNSDSHSDPLVELSSSLSDVNLFSRDRVGVLYRWTTLRKYSTEGFFSCFDGDTGPQPAGSVIVASLGGLLDCWFVAEGSFSSDDPQLHTPNIVELYLHQADIFDSNQNRASADLY